MRSICDGNEPVSFTFVCDMFAVKITKKYELGNSSVPFKSNRSYLNETDTSLFYCSVDSVGVWMIQSFFGYLNAILI